jgi:predicted GIY-YIG superfamily endonuclease
MAEIIYQIYKIFSEKGDKVYYGSTSKSLVTRFRRHKTHHCSSRILFEEYGYEYCKMILLETCSNKEEALYRERWYIENHSCVNKFSPIKSKEEKAEYNKKYFEEFKKTEKFQKKIETLKSEIECPTCHVKMMKANLSRHNKINHTDRIVKCKQCDWEGHQGKLHYHMRSHKKL